MLIFSIIINYVIYINFNKVEISFLSLIKHLIYYILLQIYTYFDNES